MVIAERSRGDIGPLPESLELSGKELIEKWLEDDPRLLDMARVRRMFDINQGSRYDPLKQPIEYVIQHTTLLDDGEGNSIDALSHEIRQNGGIETEPTGQQLLAHLMRTSLMAEELSTKISQYRNGSYYEQSYLITGPITPQLKAALFLHDIGKMQLALKNPGILSSQQVYSRVDQDFMKFHPEISSYYLYDAGITEDKLLLKMVDYHHALHPREYNTGNQLLTEEDTKDDALMYGLIIEHLIDSADALCGYRSYTASKAKESFTFPTSGTIWGGIERWAARMIVLPTSRDREISEWVHSVYPDIVSSFASLARDPDTLTYAVLNAPQRFR